MNRYKMLKNIILVLLALATAVACTREPEDIDLIRHMVVQTDYRTDKVTGSTNVFHDYSTFVLRKDTVGFVSTYNADTILLDNNSGIVNFVKATINTVEANAVANGYTRVEADENPDFAIKIIVLENFTYAQYIYYPNYYSGYYGYYGGYWGPIVSTYTSNYVTMVIQVVDIKNSVDNKYEVIWSAYIGDILAATGLDDRKARIVEAVGQAFKQSPYFSKN